MVNTLSTCACEGLALPAVEHAFIVNNGYVNCKDGVAGTVLFFPNAAHLFSC